MSPFELESETQARQSSSIGSVTGDRRAELPRAEIPDSPWAFNSATLFLITILIAILAAIGSVAPGLAVFVAILSLPPLVRTAMVLHRRRSLFPGEKHGMDLKALLFATSLGVTAIVLIVTTFCAFGCGCAVSLLTYAILDAPGIGLALLFGMVAGGAAAFPLLYLFSKWIRRRWILDTEHPTLPR